MDTASLLQNENIEPDLIEAIQPIRGYVLATSIHHCFSSGIFDALKESEIVAIDHLASSLNFELPKLKGFVTYLANEGILQVRDPYISLTKKGKSLERFRGWFTMMIGGYGSTYLQIGEKLKKDSGWASRDATQVGIGSCGISHYDSIPLTKSLMQKIEKPVQSLLDLGCGNGLYLVEFCKQVSGISALGVEKDEGACVEGRKLIAEAGLSDRVELVCSPAVSFLEQKTAFQADLSVLGFVLHEILAQEGERGVIRFLQNITDRYPDIHLIVIEVDNRFSDPTIMQHGLATAYYNPYYLMHYFTCQRLETTDFWRDLFEDAGLEVLAEETTRQEVDSTGLEVGFLLRKERA